MENNLINEVYSSLSRYGIVDSEAEFSELFLGKSECFLRTLRHQRREPHLGIYAICQSHLQAAAHQLALNQRYQHISKELEQLAGRCHEIVNRDAVVFDLPA